MKTPEFNSLDVNMDEEIELLMAERGKAEARLETELNALAEEIMWLDALAEQWARLFGVQK